MRVRTIWLLGATLVTSQAGSVASAQIAEAQVDFGNVTEAALASGEEKVVLKNESDHAVVLDKVTAGCGCVQVTWATPQRLGPGQTVETVAHLNAEAINVGSFVYPLVAEVDGKQMNVGEVRYVYEPLVSPGHRTIWLESRDALKVLEGRFSMLTDGKIDVADVSVVVPDYIKASIIRSSQQGAEVTLSYRNDEPLRERKSDVLLKVAGSEDVPLKLTAYVPALDLVALDPGAVLLPAVKVDELATRSVRLRALTGQPLKTADLEVVSDDGQVRGALREADGATWLDVTVRAKQPGVSSATLVLRDRDQTWSVPINTTWRTDD